MDKKSLITSIATLAGIPDPGMGRDLFVGACARLGIDSNGTMPELAQRIITAANLPYRADHFDSRLTPSGGGSTVTLEGLQAIKAAIVKLLP